LNRVLRNRPAAGHCRGLAESFHLIARRSPFNVVLRRCSATLLGFYPDCPSQLFSSRAGVFHFRGYAPTCRRASRLPRRFQCSPPLSRTRPGYGGHGPIRFELRLLGFSPAGQPFSCIGAARLGLGTKGRFDPRTVSALGFSSFGRRVRRTPAHRFRVLFAPGLCLRGGRRFYASARRAFTTPRHRFRRRREGALQRFNEFDGLSHPAMFSSGRVCPFEVSHRPRNARRSLFAGHRSPAVTSGATCLEMSFT
jgi:hypothetical protein